MADNKIVLGSGKLYITTATFSGGTVTIPADNVIETDTNLLGYISGGATLTYKPSYTEVKDDLGIVRKKFLTSEEAIFKSGVLTWHTDTLNKLIQTGTITTDSVAGTQTLSIGGVANFNEVYYIIRFVYEDNTDGDIRATIVGSNEAGLELSFQKDKETIVNAEFKAFPMKADGTLILITEEV